MPSEPLPGAGFNANLGPLTCMGDVPYSHGVLNLTSQPRIELPRTLNVGAPKFAGNHDGVRFNFHKLASKTNIAEGPTDHKLSLGLEAMLRTASKRR